MSKITLVFDKEVPDNIRELARVMGHFEQPVFGNTLHGMIEHDLKEARQQLRDDVMAHLGYEYRYTETQVVVLQPIKKDS